MSTALIPALAIHLGQRLVPGHSGVVNHHDRPRRRARAGRRLIRSGRRRRGSTRRTARTSPVDLPGDPTTADPSSAGRSRQKTRAPSAVKQSRAVAAPMPRAAPVTSATLPSSGRVSTGPSRAPRTEALTAMQRLARDERATRSDRRNRKGAFEVGLGAFDQQTTSWAVEPLTADLFGERLRRNRDRAPRGRPPPDRGSWLEPGAVAPRRSNGSHPIERILTTQG